MEMGTARQWGKAGVSRSQLRAKVERGELVRQRHGTYATAAIVARAAGDPATRHALDVAAVLMARSVQDGVASHESAARVHAFPLVSDPPGDVVTLTRPPGKFSGASPAGIRYLSAQLACEHVTIRHGIPVTTAGRTVIDLARTLPFRDAVTVADAALHSRAVDKPVLSAVIAQCSSWPGIARARRVVEFSDERSESPLESCARVVFAEHGLPAPELQQSIMVTADRVSWNYRADFCWPRHMTVAETDGLSKYDSGADAIAELKRDRLLRAEGYKVVHITWKELMAQPADVIQRLLRAFAATSPY